MVDANLQREEILPSEKAFAYKMKFDALSHQGKRSDLTSCQVGTKSRTDEIMAKNNGDSARTIQRYIRLTELLPDLLAMVDSKKIKFNPGGKDAIQLMTFAAYVRRIMDENADLKLISVLS